MLIGEGHLPDTPMHRQMILDVASDPNNYFAKIDNRGNLWCEKILDNGSQIWVQIRNGQIRNAGVNSTPVKWHPDTGLAKPIRPW